MHDWILVSGKPDVTDLSSFPGFENCLLSTIFGKDAVRYGTAALSQISKETEQRPLIAIAVALGVGILIGMATRNRS